MKGLNLTADKLKDRLAENDNVEGKASIPGADRLKEANRKKVEFLGGANTVKKMVLGTQRIFRHVIVEAGQVEKRTNVFNLNERDQELLNKHGVADILPDIRKNKRNDFEAFARKDGNNFELADGSRRRRACILGGAALLLWVCDDLTDKEMEYLSDSGNKHRQASVYERGVVMERWIKEGRYTSSADISRERDIARRTVDRCRNAAKLPKWLIEAYRTPNDMSVESAGKLHDVVSKNLVPIDILERRAKAQKVYWESTKYSGAEITKRLVAPVIDPDEQKKKSSGWLVKGKARVIKGKNGFKYELPVLDEVQQTKLKDFIEELLK